MIVGVQDVYYNVADMARAVAFYRDILGMRVLDTNEWWTSLDCFGARIGLHGAGVAAIAPVPHDDHGPHAGATLTLRSTDLAADVTYLSKSGVKVLSQSKYEWGEIALFADSEGNLVKLMQPSEAQ